MSKVEITVISQKGICIAKHKKDQKFLYDGQMPQKFCTSAFVSLYPSIRTLQYGGNFPWEKEGEASAACGDHENPVIFRLKRVP